MDDHAWEALIEDAEHFRYSPGQADAFRLSDSFTSADYEALFKDATASCAE